MVKLHTNHKWYCLTCDKPYLSHPGTCSNCRGFTFIRSKDPGAPCNKEGEEENKDK